MFKTRLVLNKDSIIILFCSLGIIILFIVNLLMVVPLVYETMVKQDKKSTGLPIDIQTVNKAIELLNQ